MLNIFLSKEEIYVPDVVGLNEARAIAILDSIGLKNNIEYISYSKESIPFSVFSLHPRPYSKINKNRSVDLVVYSDKEEIEVSDYVGLTVKEARKRIKLDRLLLDEIDLFYYYDDSDAPNIISRQYPNVGDKVLEGANISLWICSGKPPNEYVVPTVIGLTLNEAIKKIKISGFLIGEILYLEKDDFLENTVYEISHLSSNGYNIEVLEGMKYTVPIRLNITVTKYGE
tara:strand:- start:18 stop:701 length:684 start_codon:yes stop_codon:yes gene_type:complete